MMSDVEIDPKKLEKMWKLIIEYEKADGLSDNNKTAASRIKKIIDEVYDECF